MTTMPRDRFSRYAGPSTATLVEMIATGFGDGAAGRLREPLRWARSC